MSIDKWLIASLILYIAIALRLLVYAVREKGAGFFDPIVQFLLFLSLFVIPLPVRVLMTRQIEGDITEHLPALIPYMPLAVFLTALSLPLFAVAYYSSTAQRVSARLPKPGVGQRPWISFAVLASISLALLFELARSTNGLINFVLLGYGGSSEIYGKGHLAIGFPWLFVSSLFLLYSYALRRRRLILVLFSVM